MLTSLRDLSIKTKLLTLVGTFIFGLIAFWHVSRTTLNLTRVNGPLYEKIAQDKGLMVDIKPPSLCLLEAQLIAHQLCATDDVGTVDQLIGKYRRFRDEYRREMTAWNERVLHPATRDVLLNKTRPPTDEFFAIMDRRLIPAVQLGEKKEAEAILAKQLTPLYEEHRDAIDNLVLRTNQATLIYETEVAKLISSRTNVLFGTGVIVVFIGSTLAFYIIRPILRQMRKLLYTLKAVASGDLNNRMETTGKGEFGYFAVAVNEMIDSLVKAKTLADSACEAKSEFLANMSHEIRTPLTAILGYCDILRDEVIAEQAPQERIHTISTIRRAGEHLLTVINDILDLSKIESGRLSTEQIEMPLPSVFAEVESLMRPRISEKEVELRTLLRTSVPNLIISDPTRLRQIVLNLVGNAVKFTEKGYIELRVSVDQSHGQSKLCVEVEDTGCGMTADQASALFRPFAQADASVTRKFGGTGLGLTISKRLARMMKGDVRLDFSEPGKGSLFTLELPLVEAPNSSMVTNLTMSSEKISQAARKVAVAISGRILLAEDGEDNQQLISFILKKAGATVTVADNGQIALDMLNAAIANGQPFDLLLTDMQMPVMDGYTLTKTLRASGHQIPIVALTAHAMAEDREKCLNAGCNDYASKPINKMTLIDTCEKWLERSRDARTSAIEEKEPVTSRSVSQVGSTSVLTSDLADDPDMAPRVNNFLSKLTPKITNMSEYLSANRLEDLAKMAHQLKGAGGGYGFPSISDAAQRVEQHAKSHPDLEKIQHAVDELTDLCQQAISGASKVRS